MNETFVLVTGSCGLIGSESVRLFIQKGYTVVGIDNDMRGVFFGTKGSTSWMKNKLTSAYPKQYIHVSCDIRDENTVRSVFKKYPFTLIIHTAAQPSHDWAATQPVIDFSINATGTVMLLENYRKFCPKAVFIFTSSSKVYGDRPNKLPLIEQKTRFDLPKMHRYYQGIDESLSIDNSVHSIYGASKAAADLMVQEYGKYYNLHTAVFRGNCMTGSNHSGTMQHGFLSYLVKCIIEGQVYTVFGYQGKQVRDNIHASDFVNAFYHCFRDPCIGEIYNLGGGRYSNISIVEAIQQIESLTGNTAKIQISNTERKGDHKWYISNNAKFLRQYPKWKLTYTMTDILTEICDHAHHATHDDGNE